MYISIYTFLYIRIYKCAIYPHIYIYMCISFFSARVPYDFCSFAIANIAIFTYLLILLIVVYISSDLSVYFTARRRCFTLCDRMRIFDIYWRIIRIYLHITYIFVYNRQSCVDTYKWTHTNTRIHFK